MPNSLYFLPFLLLLFACNPTQAVTQSSSSAAKSKDDLSGEWKLTVNTPRGKKTTDFSVVQLTPTSARVDDGKKEFTITIKGDGVSFDRAISTRRGNVNSLFRGRIDSPTQMSGTVTVTGGPGGGRELEWTAVR